VLSALPVVLCGYLESSERRARDQIWLGLCDRAAAIAHTFSTEQMTDRTRTAGRSAQLAGFSAETGGTTPRPALPAPRRHPSPWGPSFVANGAGVSSYFRATLGR